MGVAIADAPRKNSANRSEDHLFVRAANTHCIVGTPFVQSESVWAWHLPQTEGSARDGKNVGRGRARPALLNRFNIHTWPCGVKSIASENALEAGHRLM